MLVTLSGISISTNPLCRNALAPIVCKEDGRTTEVKELIPLVGLNSNALPLISASPVVPDRSIDFSMPGFSFPH